MLQLPHPLIQTEARSASCAPASAYMHAGPPGGGRRESRRPGPRAAGPRTGPQEAKSYILSMIIILAMFAEYIKAAMDKATYEIIDDPEPFYGEIPELRGVWATGKTLEACRDSLMSALEDWIAFRLRTGRSIPSIGGASIVVSTEPVSVVE